LTELSSRAAAGASAALDARILARAHDELVATLRDLIRIPSVNPPDPAGPELRVAEYLAAALADAGVEHEVFEPFPGRGSVTARLRGDGSGGEPLLLMSHLDVVPAAAADWIHEPFGADVADGYVWGRGAVDMKGTIAMDLAVIRLLAAEARAAGGDPRGDPVPGLTRDVLFAATADEEAGGREGMGWLVDHHPERVRAAGALNECGAISVTVAGRRLYPIQVAEKGYAVYRITVHGAWGHASMPRNDNALVRTAEVVTRLAQPAPLRLTPVMDRFLRAAADALPRRQSAVLLGIAEDAPDDALDAVCEPAYARALRALLRDTISPTILRAGVKYNVIPGVAELHLDCRVLPGTSEADVRADILSRLGSELADACDVELLIFGAPAESAAEGPLYDLLARTVRDHDADGAPLPVMAPFATDAKHTARLGIPTYGFSPLRLADDEPFLERFHGVDERVGLDALRWGLPVLYDVVRRFCG
jgi:acetylornithine deacetylase/succinyl-diaminopimelate desuccinylase-like protein